MADETREEETRLAKQLFLQTTDGSQCISWTDSQVRVRTFLLLLSRHLLLQLTYLGRECKEIPRVLIDLYASVATRVDLSFCSLCTLRGLEAFTCLQELVLDNNCLDDGTTFPSSRALVTLSLNKNKASTSAVTLPLTTSISSSGSTRCCTDCPGYILASSSSRSLVTQGIRTNCPILRTLLSTRDSGLPTCPLSLASRS